MWFACGKCVFISERSEKNIYLIVITLNYPMTSSCTSSHLNYKVAHLFQLIFFYKVQINIVSSTLSEYWITWRNHGQSLLLEGTSCLSTPHQYLKAPGILTDNIYFYGNVSRKLLRVFLLTHPYIGFFRLAYQVAFTLLFEQKIVCQIKVLTTLSRCLLFRFVCKNLG